MFDNISYKMNENEIKSRIRDFYLPSLSNFLSFDDYKKTRKKYLCLVTVLIVIALVFILRELVPLVQLEDTNLINVTPLLFILLFIVYIVLVPLLDYINQKFIQYVRDRFINKIIYECINLNEFKYKKTLPYIRWEMLRKQKDEEFLIKNHELLNLSEHFKHLKYKHRITYSAYDGTYHDTYFAIENIEVYMHTTRDVVSPEYKGIILKATFNDRLDKEKCNNEEFKNIISRVGKLLNAKETKYNIYDNNIIVVYTTNDKLFKFYNFLNISKSQTTINHFISDLTGIFIFVDYIASEF